MDKDLIRRLETGDRRALAQSITAIERDPSIIPQFFSGFGTRYPLLVAFAGSPGCGKSSLIDGVLTNMPDQITAVFLIDPSSSESGGSILGDRLRINEPIRDNLYIRSFASGPLRGGLALALPAACRLASRAGYDLVMIETVGIGQREDTICDFADFTFLVTQPQTGDEIQVIKSGIAERVNAIIVNKSDLPGSEAFYQVIKTHARPGQQEVMLASAVNGDGSDQIVDLIRKLSTTIDRPAADSRKKRFETQFYTREFLVADIDNKMKNSPELDADDPYDLAREYLSRYRYS